MNNLRIILRDDYAVIILSMLYGLVLKMLKKESHIPVAFIMSIVYTVLLFINL